MSRRVRSASAWNRASARSASSSITQTTYNQVVVCCQDAPRRAGRRCSESMELGERVGVGDRGARGTPSGRRREPGEGGSYQGLGAGVESRLENRGEGRGVVDG